MHYCRVLTALSFVAFAEVHSSGLRLRRGIYEGNDEDKFFKKFLTTNEKCKDCVPEYEKRVREANEKKSGFIKWDFLPEGIVSKGSSMGKQYEDVLKFATNEVKSGTFKDSDKKELEKHAQAVYKARERKNQADPNHESRIYQQHKKVVGAWGELAPTGTRRMSPQRDPSGISYGGQGRTSQRGRSAGRGRISGSRGSRGGRGGRSRGR